jgi:HSP20 family protein
MTKQHWNLNYIQGGEFMLARFEKYQSVDPLIGELLGFSRDVDSLYAASFESPAAEDAAFAPPLDVSEDKAEVVVVAALPGVKKENVKISLEKGVLTIGGTREEETLSGGARGLLNEQRKGKFARTVRLPYEVNPANVSAELSDGLLRIVLPKAEAARAHEITVR